MSSKQKKLRLRKGRAACLLAALIALVLFFAYTGWRYFNPIRFTADRIRVELGSTPDPKDWIASVFLSSKKEVKVLSDLDAETPGSYQVIFQAGKHRQILTVQVVDTTAPVLEVQNLETGLKTEVDPESFVLSCTDLSRTTLSIENPESISDYSAGTYTVKISAMDEYGNKTIKTAALRRSENAQTPAPDEHVGENPEAENPDAE